MINKPKRAIGWSGFNPRHNHAGHVIGIAELTDQYGVTMPGLTLQIEIKAAVEVERCLYLFSIMRFEKKKRIRDYQLEVAPASKKTHIGDPDIYGPHEHVGDTDEPTPVNADAVSCGNWDGVLQWFFNRVSIIPFLIEDPNGKPKL